MLLITALYLLLYRTMWFKKNVKRKFPKEAFWLHVLLCVLSAALAIMHVSSKLPFFTHIPLLFRVSGIAMLSLLALQIVVGVMLKYKPNKRLFRIHKTVPAVLLAILVVHAVVLKTVL